jgi:Glyoxalase-like domain
MPQFMALFYTDSIVLVCASVEAAKRWWIDVFDGKPMKPPANWDNALPSDVALKLPGHDQPTVLLCDRSELEQAHMDTSPTYPVLFTGKLKKAHEHLLSKGVATGPMQDGGDMLFFEITDPEGHVFQICQER